MVKFSKKIEYALVALHYLSNNPEAYFSARELSEILNIPYEFLSKTLAKLAKSEILISNHGAKGGYKLNKSPRKITFYQIFASLEEHLNVVECLSNEDEICQRSAVCTIKTPMFQLQNKINELIGNMTLEDWLKFPTFDNAINV